MKVGKSAGLPLTNTGILEKAETARVLSVQRLGSWHLSFYKASDLKSDRTCLRIHPSYTAKRTFT